MKQWILGALCFSVQILGADMKISELIIKNYNTIEPQYPSYVDHNSYGLCLRALRDLDPGTIVATADFEKTEKSFIAGHASPEYKYVALMAIMDEGKPLYGRVRGKWAFCNHSCDPNCTVSVAFQIITNRFIAQGEELTTSYDSYVPDLPWQEQWNFECLCGALQCKKVIKKYRMDILHPVTRLALLEDFMRRLQ